jgi:hypothetical protein
VDGLEEDVEKGRTFDGVAAACAQPGHEGADPRGRGRVRASDRRGGRRRCRRRAGRRRGFR